MSDTVDSESSDFEDIRPYFLDAHWREISKYEKRSYRNSKRNFQLMQQAGLVPKPPHFIQAFEERTAKEKAAKKRAAEEARSKTTKRRKRTASSDDEADETWMPEAGEKPGPSRRRRAKFVPPTRNKAKAAPQAAARSKKATKQGPAAKQAGQAKQTPVLAEEGVPAVKQVEEAAAREGPSRQGGAAGGRYPKRAGSRKSYVGVDDDVPDDNEIFCDDCDRSWEGDCPVHGPLEIIPDTQVEAKDPMRALHTVPPQLAVLESKIRGAGMGVWTKAAVPRRVRFGPYEGDIVPANRETGYGWEIRKDGKPTHCVDASREASSNWMRYVNCPRNVAEANLHPYQHLGRLYYRTVCDVPANTELLVWYGDSYGKELGIDAKAFKAPPQNPRTLTGTFPCGVCALCFVSPLLQAQHRRSGSCSGELRRRRAAAASGTPLEGPAAAASGSERKHRCITCGAAFDRPAKLQRHLRTHSGEKPYSCDTCGQAFTLSWHLSAHRRTHTGEKPFSCGTCGQAFARSSTLALHRRTHSGEKPFSCGTCGQAFARSCDLSVHRRTHSGEKPFRCTTCGQAFAQKRDLRRHAFRNHPPAPAAHAEVRPPGLEAAPALVRTPATHAQAASKDPVSSSSSAPAPVPAAASNAAPLPLEPVQCVQEAAVSSSSSGSSGAVAPSSSQPKAFACAQCSKGFRTKSGLSKHQQQQGSGPCGGQGNKENRRPSPC